MIPPVFADISLKFSVWKTLPSRVEADSSPPMFQTIFPESLSQQ
jgi:hypothetical protein